MKITVRLSKPNVPIQRLLKANHQLTGPITNWANIGGSEVYYGTVYAGTPSWLNFLNSGTSTTVTNLSNVGAAALIFVPINNRYMILSFGYANSKLSSYGLERDFGLRVVLNSIDPDKVKSIDTKIMGNVIMNKRTQLSKDKKIEDFGFEINKDFLRHIAGKPSSTSFASMISGSDSLNMNCDISITNISQKINDIYAFYSGTTYQTNYSWIDDIKNVKDGVLLPLLNDQLILAFNSLLAGNTNDLYVACPTIIDYGLVDHYRVRGYRSLVEFNIIEIDNLIADLVTQGITTVTLADLENFYIEAINTDGNVVSHWKIYDWLIYEHFLTGIQYIYNDGEWFEISNNFFSSTNTAWNNIITSSTEYLILPPTTHKTEEGYIAAYLPVKSKEIIFDRKLFYKYGVTNSVEICDLYNSSREFIHIKEGNSSAKLSHLFNQGFVSATLFLNDVYFRDDISIKLNSHKTLLATIGSIINSSKYTVVYRILKKGSTITIPFFSKLTLLDVHKKIKNMGYKFRLEWVQKI